MQNTRLNRLLEIILDQLRNQLRNPWRRLSVLCISLLFGNFLATVLTTFVGQAARQDTVVSFVLVLLHELVNRLVYRQARRPEFSLGWEALNSFKLGLTYALFVEAFKLGS
ncbi:DUF565 domain-containing protein [Trichothermofontia sp.]